MLNLAEPCIVDELLDRPNLGCAMLIAACQEKGIKATSEFFSEFDLKLTA